MDKLSKLQKDILRITLILTNHQKELRRYVEYWGLNLASVRRNLKSGRKWSRSNSAAFSRSLTRLEKRGLIVCQNDWTKGNRTNCIKLTEKGVRQAEGILAQKENG